MPCVHLTDLEPIEPKTPQGCEECLQSGGQWVHLRLGMECGHVWCCVNSPNTHATRHFHVTGQGVIQSYEPGERGVFCYVDNAVFDPIPEEVSRSYR